MTALRWTSVLIVVFVAAVMLVRVRQIFGKDIVKDVIEDPSAADATATTQPSAGRVLDFTVKDIDGKDVNLADYKGKAVLIVNVASKCGFTPQYTGLEKLYETYKDKGFVIIGFPANNFKSQEPGSDAQIKEFCTNKYNVTFPIMSKISVKGDDKAPIYHYVTEPATAGEFAGEITWNFNKFLVDRHGNLMARFASPTKPEDPQLVAAVEKALNAH
jgi:glutathione peroxidase